MLVKTKIPTLQELMDLRSNGVQVNYDSGIHTGIVRRAEFDKDEKAYVIAVKHEQAYGYGLSDLSIFKFYKSRASDIHLSSFFYDKDDSK